MNYLVDIIICIIGFITALSAVRDDSVSKYSEALPYLFGMLGWVTFGALSVSNYIPIVYIVGEKHNHTNMQIFWIYTVARFLLLIAWYLLVRKTLNSCKIKHKQRGQKCQILNKYKSN
ncbi:MAG: hypothetical protein PHG15_03645 [Acinetobacter sp.]|uniref:hypothetical protein n=1 Tax=Acinetobacter sp. TaxID=472 RepID=UPI00261B84CD|nr:hypothetical protein [Acinetobacter sp.]MDD2944905.1 hypothetical protein [Acinetobacter sp.]